MESTELLSRPARRPWVVFVAMAFLGYAAFVALPMVVLGSQGGLSLTTVQVALSFVACFALGFLGRWRATFHLARLALALWAVRAVYASWQMIVAPWFSVVARPQPPLIQCLMALGAGALCVLFWSYGFGRRSRTFYEVGGGKLKVGTRE